MVPNLNPFAPVSGGALYEPNDVMISTPAVAAIVRMISTFLAVREPRAGRIVALTGEHGTGKTYLARHALNQFQTTADRPVRTMYLLAHAQTFVELYRDFADELLAHPTAELRNLVRKVYAGTVADVLRTSQLTVRVAAELDRGALDPILLVERYGLAESDLLRLLQQRLETVTSAPEFSVALTLMLRPAFEPAVREWLLGHSPDPALQERGIMRTIDTEELALQAVGVFALLYGFAGMPFMLVIDEIEQILLRSDRPDRRLLDSFQHFLEIFVAAGAFLLLTGVSDALDSLAPRLRQRIGTPLRVSPLTAADVGVMFAQARPGLDGAAALVPFTPATIEYLVNLSRGVARTVIKLGHRLYETAEERGVEVTPAMVREAVRAEYDLNSEVLRREIKIQLSAVGWPHKTDFQPTPPGISADYWIELASDAHCAVLVTGSVLTHDTAADLAKRAATLRQQPGDVEVILVVNGILAADFESELTGAVGGRLLRFDAYTFSEDFSLTLRGVSQQLLQDRAPEEEVLRLLKRTANQMELLRTDSQRQYAAILELLRPSPPLSHEIAAIFADAQAALSPLTGIEEFFQSALLVDGPAMDHISSAEVLQAAGGAFLQAQLLTAFRNAVARWYSEPAGSRNLEHLARTCRRFDTMCAALPESVASGLTDLTHSYSGALGSGILQGLGDRIWTASRRQLGDAYT